MIDRRTALTAPLWALAAPALAQGPRHGPARRVRRPGDDLAWIDATETAARIRLGELSAREAVEAAIARAEALNPKLAFLVTPDFDRARERAGRPPSGPFGGVPFLVKDLDNYRGLPTRHGSRAHADAAPATEQSPLIDRDEAAGFVVLGKSATPEQGYLPTTEPLGQPPTRNPWDPARSSGGSSGGAAAAVASGVVPIAHASDGGGSIRIPASNCGLFGLKPSRGRLLPAGRGGPPPPVDIGVEHCVSRSVRDSATLFAWTERTGPESVYPPVGMVSGPSRRRLRVGLVLVGVSGVAPDPEVAAAVQSSARLLENLGHRVEPTAWPVGADFTRDFITYWASGAALDAQAAAAHLGRQPTDKDLEPFSLGMARMVAAMPPSDVGAAIGRLKAVAPAYDAWLQKYDVILSPVLRTPAPRLGYVRGDVAFDELVARLTAYVGYTPIHNVAGAPAMSVPLGWSGAGLPIGSQLAARAGGERTLLELAYELEAARPWAARRPAMHA